jgi:hypothetical protein
VATPNQHIDAQARAGRDESFMDWLRTRLEAHKSELVKADETNFIHIQGRAQEVVSILEHIQRAMNPSKSNG